MLYMICQVIMRKTIIDQDIALAQDRRLIKRLWKVDKSKEFPLGLEFALQVLFLHDEQWIRIVRIDNQLHGGKPGTHVHTHKRIIWTDIPFEEAEQKIIELAEKIIANMRIQ